MVIHKVAMRIRYNKSTLHRLPRPGVKWSWGDVVDAHDESKVDSKHAHAVKSMFERHDDGTYETTKRLEEYLDAKYSIELTGSAMDTGQSTLPGTGRGIRRESRMLADGSGSGSGGRQYSLNGDDVEDDMKLLEARTVFGANADAADQEHAAKHERVGPGQARLGAFAGDAAVRVSVKRASGDVYPSTGRVRVDA